MNKYRRTMAAGFVLCISLFYYICALFIESRQNRGIPGSDFLPQIVGLLLVALSLILIVSAYKQDRRDTAEEKRKTETVELVNVLGTAIIIGVYIGIMKPLGFMISTMLYLFVQFIYLTDITKIKDPKIFVKYAVIAVCASVGVYFLFLKGLNLILPAGILG